MNCPRCHNPKALNLQTVCTTDGRVRRRRQCPSCGYRFTTYEVYVAEIREKRNETLFKPGKRGPKKHEPVGDI